MHALLEVFWAFFVIGVCAVVVVRQIIATHEDRQRNQWDGQIGTLFGWLFNREWIRNIAIGVLGASLYALYRFITWSHWLMTTANFGGK